MILKLSVTNWVEWLSSLVVSALLDIVCSFVGQAKVVSTAHSGALVDLAGL